MAEEDKSRKVEFLDVNYGLMKLEWRHDSWWLFYKHADGQWVSLRQATPADLDQVNRLASSSKPFGTLDEYERQLSDLRKRLEAAEANNRAHVEVVTGLAQELSATEHRLAEAEAREKALRDAVLAWCANPS